jgi:hypothetical protein
MENAEVEHAPAVAATRIFMKAMVVVLYLLTRGEGASELFCLLCC